MMYAEVAIATLLNIFKSMGSPYDRLKCTMYANLWRFAQEPNSCLFFICWYRDNAGCDRKELLYHDTIALGWVINNNVNNAAHNQP